MTLVGKPIHVVGQLSIHGDRFAFRPAEAKPFAVRAGKEFEVALTYEYVEASPDKETAAIRFTASLGGKALGARDARIEDRPLVLDRERGTLALVARAGQPGEVEGTFAIEAGYASAPWSGGEGGAKGAAFQHQGRFRVRAT